MRLHNAKDNIDAVLREGLVGALAQGALKYGSKVAKSGITKGALKYGGGGGAVAAGIDAANNGAASPWEKLKGAGSAVKKAVWDNPLDAIGSGAYNAQRNFRGGREIDAAREAHLKTLNKNNAEKANARIAAEKAAQDKAAAKPTPAAAPASSFATSLKSGYDSAKKSIMANSKSALDAFKSKTAEVKKGYDNYQTSKKNAAPAVKAPAPAPIRPVAPAQPVLPPPPPVQPQAYMPPPPPRPVAPVQPPAPQPLPQAPQQSRVQRAQQFYGVGKNRRGSAGGPRR